MVTFQHVQQWLVGGDGRAVAMAALEAAQVGAPRAAVLLETGTLLSPFAGPVFPSSTLGTGP